MVKIECRRQADPQMVQRLWEAITFIRNQKQVANHERIQKYMQRQYRTSETDCMWQVNYASEDGLLLKEMSTSKKGQRAGQAQEAFWCVEDTGKESEESHDWYCFTCHKPGKVWCCDTCHRVYHPQCLTDEKEGIEGERWSCAACLSLKKDTFEISRRTLYKLLDFVLARMKDKASELHRKLKLSIVPNYYHLVYRHVDLGTIMENVERKRYKSISDFELSAQDMVHTSAVYYSVDSDRTTLSELTLNDCRYDLAEIGLCVDCYLASNNKVGDDWFCTPCKPIHELAWVHMKGFGFWPAKILCRKEGRVDVRFFGKKHERALVPEEDVKHIDTDLKQLRIKKSKGWENALKELNHHKVLIELGVTHVREEEGDDIEEEEEPVEEKPAVQRGTKRKADQREAEELVKKTHSDAGQVNSISTSQEEHANDGTPRPKKKRRKIKTEPTVTTPTLTTLEEGSSESPPQDSQDLHVLGLPSDDAPPSQPEKEKAGGSSGDNSPEDEFGDGWKEEDDEVEAASTGRVEDEFGDGWKEEDDEVEAASTGRVKVKKEVVEKKTKPTPKGEGKTKKRVSKGKKGENRKASKDLSRKAVKEEESQETMSEVPKNKGKKRKSMGANNTDVGSGSGGNSKTGGSSGNSKTGSSGSIVDGEDLEMKYRQKLADYKAHQEMESQARIEKAVEEAVSMAQKKWEMDRSASEVKNATQNEEQLAEALRKERESLAEEHATAIIQLKEKHKEEISQTKKRQWCINCEQEAMYHCCWNTSYCSISCQQIHWHKEHKRLCRRKR